MYVFVYISGNVCKGNKLSNNWGNNDYNKEAIPIGGKWQQNFGQYSHVFIDGTFVHKYLFMIESNQFNVIICKILSID